MRGSAPPFLTTCRLTPVVLTSVKCSCHNSGTHAGMHTGIHSHRLGNGQPEPLAMKLQLQVTSKQRMQQWPLKCNTIANVGKIHKTASIRKISHINQCCLYKLHVIILHCGGQGCSQGGHGRSPSL